MNAEEDGTKRIVQTINRILDEEALPDERLERAFNTYWHCLEEDLKKIREGTLIATKPMRPQSDMIEAILITVREHSRILSNLAPQFNTRSKAPSC
jgi:hypothetical protein